MLLKLHCAHSGSGTITVEELREVLANNDVKEFATIDAIVKEIDQDDDGHINYEEFVYMMRNTGGETLRRKNTRRLSFV